MKKVIYFILIILAFFIGVIGTLITMKDVFIQEKIVEKQVVVSESDTIKSAIDLVYDSVVMIESYKNSRLAGTGTGFVYKKDDTNAYIITNHHVIDGASTVKVVYINGNTVNAKILGSDTFADLAVLQVDASSALQVAKIGASSKSNLGDVLFTVGSPLGSEYMGTVTKGILSGKDRMVEVDSKKGKFIMNVIQTDAAINPGNSGGPLVNISGEVIGVNSLKLVESEVEGMGFAIPIELAMSVIGLLEKGEEIIRPVLGVSVIDVTDNYSLFMNSIYLKGEYENGVVIFALEEDKPASAAGLMKKDIILEVDGEKVKNLAHFRFILFKYRVGDTIKIKYDREGEEKIVDIKLSNS